MVIGKKRERGQLKLEDVRVNKEEGREKMGRRIGKGREPFCRVKGGRGRDIGRDMYPERGVRGDGKRKAKRRQKTLKSQPDVRVRHLKVLVLNLG